MQMDPPPPLHTRIASQLKRAMKYCLGSMQMRLFIKLTHVFLLLHFWEVFIYLRRRTCFAYLEIINKVSYLSTELKKKYIPA